MLGRRAVSRLRFGYRGKKVENVAPFSHGQLQLEPLAQAAAKQHPALPLFSKGEV
jgi:hypothetical protein